MKILFFLTMTSLCLACNSQLNGTFTSDFETSAFRADTVQNDPDILYINYMGPDSKGELIKRAHKVYNKKRLIGYGWIAEDGNYSYGVVNNLDEKPVFLNVRVEGLSCQIYYFHENGQVKSISSYDENDELNEWYTEFDKNGILTKKEYYVHGVLQKK